MTLLAMSVMTSSCSKCENNENMANGTNQAIETIMTRTSVRNYSDRQVSADTVEIILKAAMAAPTAANKQPWKFYVIKDEKVRNAIADSLAHGQRMLREASVAIVVAGDATKFFEDESSRDFWVEDCSAATENLLLAAHALGLGAVWCGVYPDPVRVDNLRKAIGASKSVVPLCIVPIGYPAGEQTPKDKWDPEKVTYID